MSTGWAIEDLPISVGENELESLGRSVLFDSPASHSSYSPGRVEGEFSGALGLAEVVMSGYFWRWIPI